jgi:molybdopterin-binding protein
VSGADSPAGGGCAFYGIEEQPVALPGGGTVTSSVTNDAVDALGLAVGQNATATFKAYAVMVAVKA